MPHPTLPSTLPFLTPVSWPGGLERLFVTPPRALGASVPPQSSIDAALGRLKAAGLRCRGTSSPRLHILGGGEEFLAREIHGYEEAFAILAEDDGQFLAMVSGTRRFPRDEEASFASLSQAVDMVLKVYGARGLLTAGTLGR